jgi:RimJ/RimL family protein N-acetyltransferase
VSLADDLWILHQDPDIAEWWGTWSRERVVERARSFGEGWANDGVSKWLAYDAITGELIGRGGLSYVEVDGAFRHELGWAVRSMHQRKGYATEIGEAGLDFGFHTLGAEEIVAFTEPHNVRSRAVMERLGMRFVRDITHEDGPFVLYVKDRP